MRKCLPWRKLGFVCAVFLTLYLVWLFYVFINTPAVNSNGKHVIAKVDLEEEEGGARREVMNPGDVRPMDEDFLSLASVHEYCNPPDSMLLGDEGKAPSMYNLEMVHVLIRHGDRTPMHRIGAHRNPPVSCKFSQDLISQDKIVQQYLKHLTQNSKRHHPGSDFAFWEAFPDEETCDFSKLTPIGAYQHLINGRNLYYKYADRLKLFTKRSTGSNIIVRSSEKSRTFQSAVAFMFGFTPNFNFSDFVVRKSPTNFCSGRLTGHSCNCPGIMKYLEKSEKFAGQLNRNGVAHQDIRKQFAEVYDVPVGKIPHLTQVMDIMMGQACHKIPLRCGPTGKCVDKSTVDIMWSLIEEEGIKGRVNNENYLKYSHLSFHPLLSEIILRMTNFSKLKTSTKFILYSGHDITLTPFLTLLGIYDGKWPPYASRLCIEMYGKMEEGKSHHFIRVVYNGMDVTSKLKFCKTFVDGMCRLKHFQIFAKSHLKNIGIKSYKLACKKL